MEEIFTGYDEGKLLQLYRGALEAFAENRNHKEQLAKDDRYIATLAVMALDYIVSDSNEIKEFIKREADQKAIIIENQKGKPGLQLWMKRCVGTRLAAKDSSNSNRRL